MPSLMELVEKVNKGETIDSEPLEIYEESSNSAEKFLAHHAHSMLDLRRAHQHMMSSLEAIDYADQKVLNQFISISTFIGQPELRCGPIVKFGSCAINRREYALGIEAIQNAVSFDIGNGTGYSDERENCLFVAQQYERVAASVGWCHPHPKEWNHKLTRIAYVTSGMADDDAATKMIGSFARQYDNSKFKLSVYSTEAGTRRERTAYPQTSYVPASTKRAKDTLDGLSKAKISTWMTPLEGDAITAAKTLADQLVKDEIDVVLFDCTQADPIASMVATWDIARAKINLVRSRPMYSSGISMICYVDQAGFDRDQQFWKQRGVESKFVLEGMDLEEAMTTVPNRSAYGIPDSAVVLSTCGSNLSKTLSGEFCETIINILRANPQAIYLCVGEGELSTQKRKFESAGVSKRVGYAGKRKDLPGFLKMADIYLAEFPNGDATGVLQAMSVERPVVAMASGDSTPDGASSGQLAEFAGSEATVPFGDSGAYLERVGKFIRDAASRAQGGKEMRLRVEQQFAFSQTVRQLEKLCDSMLSDGSMSIEPAEAVETLAA